MPIFSEDSDEENMSALLVSLKKSDILVCVKKELACHAKFEAFKISFVDNFDEHVRFLEILRYLSVCCLVPVRRMATREDSRRLDSFQFYFLPRRKLLLLFQRQSTNRNQSQRQMDSINSV